MRMCTIFLVAIAAMAACAFCSASVVVPSPDSVSLGCYNSSVALDIPVVHLAESYIIQSGCMNLDYDITPDHMETEGSQCSQDSGTLAYSCSCFSTFDNTSSWESAVGNISSGQSCYVGYSVRLDGFRVSNNRSRILTASRAYYELLAMGGSCNTTEIERGLESVLSVVLANVEYSAVNAYSNVSGVIWNSATVTVTGTCNGIMTRDIDKSKVLIPGSTTDSGSSSSSSSSSSASSVSSSSSSSNSSTVVPPITPSPTSSNSNSSSTGGKGTGTGNGNGASPDITHSTTAVIVSLISTVVGIAVIKAA